MPSPEKNGRPRRLRNIRVSDAAYELVDHFYPAEDNIQMLQLQIRPKDIGNLMNCSEDETYVVYKEMQRFYGDDSMTITIPHFCNYMEVDEPFIHLLIASFKTPPTNGNLIHKKPVKWLAGIQFVQNDIKVIRKILKERLKIYKQLYPLGEPQYKRFDNHRCIIYSDEVAAILRICLRNAQTLLKEYRKEKNIRYGRGISIVKFCIDFHQDEEDVRTFLAKMYGDDED